MGQISGPSEGDDQSGLRVRHWQRFHGRDDAVHRERHARSTLVPGIPIGTLLQGQRDVGDDIRDAARVPYCVLRLRSCVLQPRHHVRLSVSGHEVIMCWQPCCYSWCQHASCRSSWMRTRTVNRLAESRILGTLTVDHSTNSWNISLLKRFFPCRSLKHKYSDTVSNPLILSIFCFKF